ncbi:hypothetical protein LQW54_011482 [Pestalotiopsis sp. IQ-011]
MSSPVRYREASATASESTQPMSEFNEHLIDQLDIHLNDVNADGSLSPGDRQATIVRLRKMADGLEEPVHTIHRFAHLDLEKAMIQVGRDMGLFDALNETEKKLKIDEIADKVSADPKLVERMLRYYSTINVVSEVGPRQFIANNVTENLTEDVCVAALDHFHGFVSKQYKAIPEFLRKNGYQNPGDEHDTAFQMAWKTTKKPFEIMPTVPDAMEDFHTYMRLRRPAHLSFLSVYPVLNQTAELRDHQRALFVDIGGGDGHLGDEFQRKFSDIPGRIINEDMPEALARRNPASTIEHRAYDFTQPQPIIGAKFYHMRGVPHFLPPNRVHELFVRIRKAMAADSILLVDETMLPPTNVSLIAASIDLTMMSAFASMERTREEWNDLAEGAGLDITQTYAYNDLGHETVIEMRLAPHHLNPAEPVSPMKRRQTTISLVDRTKNKQMKE